MEKFKIRPVFNRRKTAIPEKSSKVEIEIFFSRTERKWIQTSIELYSNQWEDGFVVRHAQHKQLNKKITEEVKNCKAVIDSLRASGKDVNLANFNLAYERKKDSSCDSFLDFMYDEIQKRKMRDSTRRIHLIALEALRRSGAIKTFDDITPKNIRLFDTFLRREDPDREQTTIHSYHRRIKPYINEALRLEMIEESPYKVFRDTRGKHKNRQPLTQDELDAIKNLKLENKYLSSIRDMFIFCCYTGLAYADLEAFDYNNYVVAHNGINYIDGARIKTGSNFYTPILRPAMEALERNDRKFKVPTVQAYNRNLKVIAEIIGIKKPLTSHIARHTFATTVVLANGIPVETLSKMLGHAKIAVTQIYAKIMNTSVERQAEKLNGLI